MVTRAQAGWSLTWEYTGCETRRSVLLSSGSSGALASRSPGHWRAISLGDQGSMTVKSGHSNRQVRALWWGDPVRFPS